MKKLSIITICYNEPDVEKTCKSIVNQSVKDFEWIVIDGGSTGDCLKTLEKYRSDMSYFVSEKDGGIYNAMNKGIRIATGKYLLFLNAGDALYDKDVIRDILPCLTADIVYGNEWLVGKNHEKLIRGPFKFTAFFFTTEYLLRHQATFIKKSLFDRYGLYDENYRSSSDLKAFLIFIYKHKCSTRYVDRTIDIFKAYDGISSSYDIWKKETTEILEQIIGRRTIIFAKMRHYIFIHLRKYLVALIPVKKWRQKIRKKYY